ncbi:VPLPA-CTERM sorting domain-containing protein [uncultured Roseobacter sp.]|uniref:VPLPA-CTERM sorting domain-containing protein n=1 Tax=uncultured Roseobacter sp. TaxID=114847 RepID=UPI00262066C8|nr:VPLPA-CTERM sorting domain-containing protein [uncultured Roseobacter sp.]
MIYKKFISVIAVSLALAAPASAATFTGEFWDVDTGSAGDPASNIIDNLADALSIVEGADQRDADATFVSTGIDYPTGPTGPGSTSQTLSSWLGADAASLSGLGSTTMLGSIFRFTGSIFVDAGINNFTVGADDGFRLIIDGNEVASFGGTKAFTNHPAVYDNLSAAGVKSFELIFYEDNAVAVGVDFRRDGAVVQPEPVPLPASAVLLLGGLAGAGAFARRRQKAA